jgi:hypothetical protein
MAVSEFVPIETAYWFTSADFIVPQLKDKELRVRRRE